MKLQKYIQSVLLLLIGCVSLFMTVSILFDLFGIRKLEGNYVLFVVYANFFCAILYLYSVYAIWKKPASGFYALLIALAILVLAFIGLLVHIYRGGIYEVKTINAMIFRTFFTAIMAYFGRRLVNQEIKSNS